MPNPTPLDEHELNAGGAIPAEPQPEEPPADWEHITLYHAVRNAVLALPSYFRTELNIVGIPATDLHTFNTSLGATIESQAVDTLNQMRPIWDPAGTYAEYAFVRQAQRFPDVILRTATPGKHPILMGIELKGWYLLAKEGEPSYRYRVTPSVCASADLLVVVPWALTNIIAGMPRLFFPYVVNARYAAKYRNWHWQYKRVQRGGGPSNITLSVVDHFYPSKAELIVDIPASDNGGNFGRFARTGLMDGYIGELFEEKLAGIPVTAWQRFISLFSEDRTEEDIRRGLDRLVAEAVRVRPSISDDALERIRRHIAGISELLTPSPPSKPDHSRHTERSKSPP